MTRTEFIRETFDRFGTDKGSHGYAPVYSKIPPDIRYILEIGVSEGTSLRSWLEMFPQAKVYGIDIQEEKTALPCDRIVQISADIKNFSFEQYRWPEQEMQFDLIVDDGSHEMGDIRAGWQKLYSHCSNGIYVIEDVELEDVGEILAFVDSPSSINSMIQTGTRRGDRVVIAQFERMIEW